MYFVYILKSLVTDKYYFGLTTDIEKRLVFHNKGTVPSTKSSRPWKIVWYGAFEAKTKAESFEKYLKSGSGYAFSRKRFLG
ncbi:MAG: GIY-YIG nuclease family protein [Candidatus Uhrbacteria bacterium]